MLKSLFHQTKLTRSPPIARYVVRQKIRNPPTHNPLPLVYSQHTPTITNLLTNPIGGVFLLWDPFPYKTQLVVRQEALRLLRDGSIDGMLEVQGAPETMDGNLVDAIKWECGVLPDYSTLDLPDLFPRHTRTSVFCHSMDQFLMQPEGRGSVISLAHDSVMNKNFSVILCIESIGLISDMSHWNFGSKIQYIPLY